MSDRAARLHANDARGVFYITGGGISFLSEMLGTAGASRTVLEAQIPYANQALAELLGGHPDEACSQETARALAMAAFTRALEFDPDTPFGLACTASLATDRIKRGAHRAHLALQTSSATYVLDLRFSDTRDVEEALVVDALWSLAGVLSGDAPPQNTDVAFGEQRWQAVVTDERVAVSTSDHDGQLLVPGSFNPMHHGHHRLAKLAEQRTGLSAALELSIANVDKPMLDYHSIEDRLTSVRQTMDIPVWITRLPTFVDKAAHFRGATFAIGCDTLVRIDQSRYYGSPDLRDAALAQLAEYGARFLVFGRTDDERFATLESVRISDRLRALCIGVSEEDFRVDVSSSQIRAARGPAPP